MKKFICLMLVIVLTFSFYACSEKTTSDSNETTTTTRAPAPEIDPMDIFYDYHKNQITAEETHIGEQYRVTDVKISNITEDYVYITEKIDMGQYCIKLIYDKSQLDYVKTITTGDTVTFEGTLTNILFESIFTPELTFEKVIFVEKSE